MNFSALNSLNSVSIFNSDNGAWINNNETDFDIPDGMYQTFPSDWYKAVNRLSIKNRDAVKFSQPMTGEEMAAHLQEIYANFSDVAHDLKSANAKPDNSRFSSQDETKEDF